MHLSVGNVLGYNSVNGTLYGLSRNGLAILESTDVGESWRAISDREWSDIRSSRWFTPAERLDEGSLLTLNETSPQFTFVSDAWNSSYRCEQKHIFDSQNHEMAVALTFRFQGKPL